MNIRESKYNHNSIRCLLAAGFIIILISGLFFIKPRDMFQSIFRERALEVHYLDVGQGDAALIRIAGGKNILIDGGPDNLVLHRLGKNLPYFDRRIEAVILSHPHEDHINGLIEIIRRYQVAHLFYINNGEVPEQLSTLLTVARNRGVEINRLVDSAELILGSDCVLNLFNPESLDIPEDANNSLIAKLACAQKRFLFTGDNSAKVERALLSSSFDWQSDVLKAAHHGSITANSEDFLEAVNPKSIVISVGADNRFGHPSPEVLYMLEKRNIGVYRTDLQGEVFFSQY